MAEPDTLYCSDTPVRGKDPISLANEDKFYPSPQDIGVVSKYMQYEIADIVTEHIPALKKFRASSRWRSEFGCSVGWLFGCLVG